MLDSLIFALKELHQYLHTDGVIPSTMKTTKGLKKWMKTREFANNKKYFVAYHPNFLRGLKFKDENEVMLGAAENECYHYLDVCVAMQTMFNLRIGEIPLIPQPKITFQQLLHVSSPECYLLQVVWNRESASDKEKYTKNKNKTKTKISESDLYYKYVKEGDKDECDSKYEGLMFFIAGSGLGMAPHFRDGRYPTPIHQYHLFNFPRIQSSCAGILPYEPNPVKPKLVKFINVVYKVNMSDKTLKSGSIENDEEGNALSAHVCTNTNSPEAGGIDEEGNSLSSPVGTPEAGGIDALDESISVSSTMQASAKATVDPKLITELIDTDQAELLQALIELSPPSEMVGINSFSVVDNALCLDTDFEQEEYTPESNVLKAGHSSSKKKSSKKKGGILKNLESNVYGTPILESRKRKSKDYTSSSIGSTASSMRQDKKKSFIKKIKTLQAIVDGHQVISVTVVSPMRKNKGSSELKAKPTQAGMDLKASKVSIATVATKQVAGDDLQAQGKYRKLITNEWIENQCVLLMEINRLLVQLGRSRNLFAPREGWLSIIPNDPSDENYAYQLLFVMICSSSLSDTSLLHHMKSIFDLLTVTPQEIIKKTANELETLLHKMGRSNMNASNILAMTKDVIDKHNGVIPQDWEIIKAFRGVGPKIAAVVAYEAFGINHIPVDVHVLRFSKFFGWCSSNASAEVCQEDIESWMPKYFWHMVNSTIGSFCQLSASKKALIQSEMIRMRIGRDVLPQMDVYNKLLEYCNTMERKKKNQEKVSPQKGN
mgnify:CR=1 FL=1